MPTLNNNSKYATYIIHPSEQLECDILYPSQKAKLKNLLVDAIEQRVGLTPSDMSAAGKESYWQQEAYLRGQIDFINYLLAASEEAEKAATQEPTDDQTTVSTTFTF